MHGKNDYKIIRLKSGNNPAFLEQDVRIGRDNQGDTLWCFTECGNAGDDDRLQRSLTIMREALAIEKPTWLSDWLLRIENNCNCSALRYHYDENDLKNHIALVTYDRNWHDKYSRWCMNAYNIVEASIEIHGSYAIIATGNGTLMKMDPDGFRKEIPGSYPALWIGVDFRQPIYVQLEDVHGAFWP